MRGKAFLRQANVVRTTGGIRDVAGAGLPKAHF
jgi:hypothetical protein